MQTKLILENLSCANCAVKIEEEINNMENVKATVNFMTNTLNLEIDSSTDTKEIITNIKKIIYKHEPNVNLIEKTTENKNNKNNVFKRKETLIFIASVSLLLIGVMLNRSDKISFFVFLLSYILAGHSVLILAFKNIKTNNFFNEHFLMSIATIGAFALGEYAEAVAVMLFYLVGEFFQDMAVDNSRKSISSLLEIRPDYANLYINGEESIVDPTNVNVGDIIIVKSGEKVPLDGTIIDGFCTADTSAITGESNLKKLTKGDSCFSGFINTNGVIKINVTKNFENSTVSKILDLVENAISKKAKTEQFITKFAKYYTPIVVLAALIIGILPPLLFGYEFSVWISRALVFLVVSCPCAVVVSVPLGFYAGIGCASKNGILIKGANYLEALNYSEIVVFDKTGTLTKGNFNITSINSVVKITKEKLLEYGAYAENYSNHPIANSIKTAYKLEIDKSKITDYEEISGFGISVTLNSTKVLVGSSKLMDKFNINYEKIDDLGTIVYVAIDNLYAGNIIISDEIKPDSKIGIEKLKSLGIKKTAMLSGDLKVICEKVGKTLGIDEIYSELLPQDKAAKYQIISNEKSVKGKAIFVGDGINDSPVLAMADVGISMGGIASDAAIDASDVVIMTDEPSKVAQAIEISRKTHNIVMQNVIFALSFKAVFLVLSSMGIANMWIAVFADTGITILAILNSMRILRFKGDKNGK